MDAIKQFLRLNSNTSLSWHSRWRSPTCSDWWHVHSRTRPNTHKLESMGWHHDSQWTRSMATRCKSTSLYQMERSLVAHRELRMASSPSRQTILDAINMVQKIRWRDGKHCEFQWVSIDSNRIILHQARPVIHPCSAFNIWTWIDLNHACQFSLKQAAQT